LATDSLTTESNRPGDAHRSETEKAGRGGLHYGYVILVFGFLTVTGALGFARFGYATILPSMKEGLLLNNAQMGMIATGNLIGYAAFALVSGYLATRFGPRMVIGCSMFVTGVTMFCTGMAGGFGQAVALRFLTGLGSAGSNIPVMGLVSVWFGSKRRGMAAGILVGGSGLAFLVTGSLVPRVIEASPDTGWRLSWFVLGAVVVALGLLSLIFLRNRPSDKGLNPIGAEAVTLSGSSGTSGIQAPSLHSVYTSPALWHLGAVYLLYGFCYIIYCTFFSAALVADRGFSQAEAGAIWSSIGIVGIFSGILWGTVSDYIGRKYALAVVFAIHAVCYFLFATAHSTGVLYVSAILFGFSAFSIPGIVAATCGDYVGPNLAPAALGMVTLFFAVGQASAPSVAGYLADATDSMTVSFLLAAAVAVLGSTGSLTLRQGVVPTDGGVCQKAYHSGS